MRDFQAAARWRRVAAAGTGVLLVAVAGHLVVAAAGRPGALRDSGARCSGGGHRAVDRGYSAGHRSRGD